MSNGSSAESLLDRFYDDCGEVLTTSISSEICGAGSIEDGVDSVVVVVVIDSVAFHVRSSSTWLFRVSVC